MTDDVREQIDGLLFLLLRDHCIVEGEINTVHAARDEILALLPALPEEPSEEAVEAAKSAVTQISISGAKVGVFDYEPQATNAVSTLLRAAYAAEASRQK